VLCYLISWRKYSIQQNECIVLTVKHSGGSVVMWGWMSPKTVGEIAFIDDFMNICEYTKILAHGKMLYIFNFCYIFCKISNQRNS
uniref:Uncharacterized protein n=1 Tax=Stegastes partitus TaxID=144197 RepID=A0A3B5A167_9TELE